MLRRAAILQDLEPGAAKALAGKLRRIGFPAGHTVFNQGEPGERLYIILDGMVKLTCHSSDRGEVMLAVLGPSEMFGELSVVDPGPRTGSAVTLTSVRAMSMDCNVFRELITTRPQIAEQMLRVLAQRLRRTTEDLCEIAASDVAGRVGSRLLELGRRFGTVDGDTIRLTGGLTRDELAQFAGTTRESVNRVLAEFADRGWITCSGSRLVIVDPAALPGGR